MELDFKISKDDLLDFHIKHIDETKVYKQQMRFYNIYVFVLLFGMILLLRSALYTITGIIIYGIFLTFRKKIFNWRLRQKVFKIYNSDKYTNMFEETHLRFIDDGIKINTKFSEIIYKWSAIKGLYLVEQYIFITTLNRENLLIPIFSFNSLENRELFVSIITKNTDLRLKNKYPDDV